jgi:lipoprotein-anchoring transpeptidase ErfK/SrfK
MPPLHESRQAHPVLYDWHDDAGPGKIRIRIDLSEQIATYFRGDRPIGWSFVATGTEGHRTPAGSYRISEKLEEKFSGTYGWIENEYGSVIDGDAMAGDRVPAGCRYVPAPMPYWMRITSYGIGMHAGIIPEPGQPASHGCIRLPHDLAPQLFASVDLGTEVKIVP